MATNTGVTVTVHSDRIVTPHYTSLHHPYVFTHSSSPAQGIPGYVFEKKIMNQWILFQKWHTTDSHVGRMRSWYCEMKKAQAKNATKRQVA